MTNTASTDVIARGIAARLVPDVGPTLPAFVERVLAGESEGILKRGIEPSLVLAFAAFTLSVAKTAWDVYRDLTKPNADALSSTELALLRELLATRIRNSAVLPDGVSIQVREVVVEAAVEETLAEAKRLEGKR